MNRLSINMPHGSVIIVIAGLAGGLAEVLWVGASAVVLGVDASHVAHEVAATVFPASAATVGLGLAVHFFLSLALAAVFSQTIERFCLHAGLGIRLIAAIATLASVWVVNFLVVLPWLNPVFTTLLPLGVTFFSKLLFAIAMSAVLAVPILNSRRPARESEKCSVVAS